MPITASASLAHLAWLQTALSSPTSTPMVNADGSARKLFLAPSRALIEIAGISWSPDGRWLAYSEATGSVTTSQTPYHLFVKPLDGGAAVQLSSGVDNQLSPAWSPDGTEIAYENAVPTFTSSSIQIVGADGTGVRTVLTLDTGIGGLFSWSPNGISITFGQKQDRSCR